MNDIRNEFVVNDNYLVIIEYSSVDDDVEETVCRCNLNNIDDVFYVVKRIMNIDDIDEYFKILFELSYMIDYDNIEDVINNALKVDNDPY